MKKIILLSVLTGILFIYAGCKKTSTPPLPPSNQATCKLLSESTTLLGNNAGFEYAYNTDGTILSIKKYGANPRILQSTMSVSNNATQSTSPASVRVGLIDSFNVYYDASLFNHSPQTARVWVTLDGITQVDYKLYSFVYDNKDRLVKVKESTPHIVGDFEYNLSVIYNDQDNVTALKYENSTGPVSVTVIQASGYDDKPNPYTGIKNWRFMMHADWTNYDSEPIFTALSKNNPLGYTYGGFTRTMVYAYNDKGFPIRRTNTNTNASSSASFVESFDYKCE